MVAKHLVQISVTRSHSMKYTPLWCSCLFCGLLWTLKHDVLRPTFFKELEKQGFYQESDKMENVYLNMYLSQNQRHNRYINPFTINVTPTWQTLSTRKCLETNHSLNKKHLRQICEARRMVSKQVNVPAWQLLPLCNEKKNIYIYIYALLMLNSTRLLLPSALFSLFMSNPTKHTWRINKQD